MEEKNVQDIALQFGGKNNNEEKLSIPDIKIDYKVV